MISDESRAVLHELANDEYWEDWDITGQMEIIGHNIKILKNAVRQLAIIIAEDKGIEK